MEDDMTAEVVVRCSDSGHEGKVASIIKFHRRDDGRWLMGPVTVTTRGRRPRGQLWPRPYEQYLVGNTPVDPDGRLNEADKTAARGRIDMECKLCGLRVVAREETLFPILNTLAANGVSSIELYALAARLTSRSRGD
jgi:hypothetical protein